MTNLNSPMSFTARLTAVAAILGVSIPAFLVAHVRSPQKESESLRQVAAGSWRISEPIVYENISVFPVFAVKGADTSAFISLDEGLSSGDVLVTEQGSDILRRSRGDGYPNPRPWSEYPASQSGSAAVNTLVLVNRGKKPLLLLAGELVSGGKQDRIIAKDRIVPVGAPPLPLDVFCVEHGRWSNGTQFSAGNLMVHPSVREAATVKQEQSQVWAAVRNGSTFPGTSSDGRVSGAPAGVAGAIGGAAPLSRDAISATVGSSAPTQAYQKIYSSSPLGTSVNAFADEIQRRLAMAYNLKGPQPVGVVIAYGGEVAWADVFASPELFARYWAKLARSYSVEALARPQLREHASLEDARQFLEPLKGREEAETEPGVYRWREVNENHYAEIALDALAPRQENLHWLKIHRTT
ncbi:MAG TPA: DUF6569 family protein [Candidatus Acidoferrales bacterium]|nr:DUF6569 family protein [Candidatus Acidoferrales bacterium]